MALDFAFDERVSRGYTAQRAHPPAVAAQIGAAIAAAVGVGARVLELGVGTGRIARPVAAAGCRVVGIDLSAAMLAEGGPGANLRLVQGDIQRLPFRDGAFDAVLAVHVLHLVPDWRAALAEARRVARAGGALLQGRDWTDPASVAGQLRDQLRAAVLALQPNARPPAAGAAIPQALLALGGTPEPETVAAAWTDHARPADLLAGMAARADAETWALPDELLAAAVARVRGWAEATWDDLAQPQPVPRRFLLTVTRFGDGASELTA